MKNLKFIVSILTMSLFFGACSGDDSNNSNSDDTSAEQVSSIAQNGSWKITYFYDSDQEETSNFIGYTFNFNEGGELIATNGSNTLSGTWSVSSSSSSSSSNDDFNIYFPVPESNDFEDLNDDWDIISTTATKIQLTDVSGGNGGTDFLTFEKL